MSFGVSSKGQVHTVNIVTNLNKYFLKGGGQNTDPHFMDIP